MTTEQKNRARKRIWLQQDQRIDLYPEELTVITDPKHFCCDHADAARTSREDPDLIQFYQDALENGIPGEITAYQPPPDHEGNFPTWTVDGRRRRAVALWVNETLKAQGKTPIKLRVRVRNDLDETAIRRLVARLNEGAKPPSLAQQIGQAVGFRDEAIRKIRAVNARAPIDEGAIHREVSKNFRGKGPDTIARWLRVPLLAIEPKAAIQTERWPIETVDDLAGLNFDQQRQAWEAVGDAKDPKAIRAAVKAYAESIRKPTADKPAEEDEASEASAPTEKPKRPRKQGDWDALISKLQPHKGLAGVNTFMEIARWQRGEIEELALLFVLGVPIEEDTVKPAARPVDTTTKAGRDAYHRAVFDALASDPDSWLSSADLVAACGGTRDQMHTALKALHKRGLVDKHGNAVHTKYQVMPDVRWPENAPTEGKAANTAPPSESPLDLRTHAGRAALEQRILAALARGPQCTLADLIASTKACEAGVRAGIKRLKGAVASTGVGRSKRFMLAKPGEPEEVRQTVLPVAVEDARAADADAGDEDGETEEGEDAGDEGEESEDADTGDEDNGDDPRDEAYDDRTIDMFSDGTAEDVC